MTGENDKPLTEEELELARRGEALISNAVAGVRAPQSLRESIERDRERARTAREPFWRRRLIRPAAAAAAAAHVAVAVVLSTGGTGAQPSLAKVSETARLAPTDPAPASRGGSPAVLDASVGSLTFPDWEEKFGWRAVGRREDVLADRSVTTVYYRNPDGAQLGYAVVSGAPLAGTPPGREVTRDSKTYHVDRADGRTVVTWTQQGHTCVIVASSRVPEERLIDLAASRNV